ncbi:MAG: phosphatidylserine/phosphatidylglycerophosphate/cardiolipin synthase family protein [Deltaproteobacteria bacterium]|nr:phosphatidylserine/phosphatidylglycerophosphate/cardiolipin synthase family protein [Deltaproteobacteria bacterium]
MTGPSPAERARASTAQQMRPPQTAKEVPRTRLPKTAAPRDTVQPAPPRPITRDETFGPAFEAALDDQTHSIARAGNLTNVLFDGKASFTERERLILGAERTIHLQTYIFASDATGWRTARLLAARAEAKPPVTVRVIYDAVGSDDTDPAIFAFMRKHGVQVRALRETALFDRLNARWHEKNLIVDGRAAIEGGMNVGDEYSASGGGWIEKCFKKVQPEGWHDTDVRFAGPAAQEAQWDFIRNWNRLGPPLSEDEVRKALPPVPAYAGGASVRVVQNRPNDDEKDFAGTRNIERMYLLAINEAKTSITIENAYFVPTPKIRRALIAAAERGVHVRIMTNSAEASDLSIESYAGRYWYKDLLKAAEKLPAPHGSIEIHEMKTRMLHAKTASFDGTYVIVGSANLNHRSMRHDSETVVGMREPALALRMERHWDVIDEEAEPVTLETLKNDPWYIKLWSWLLHWFAYFM